MANIVQCPKCSTRLQLPPSSKGGVCPRCHTHITITPTPGAPTVPPKLPQSSAAGSTTVKPPAFVEPTGSTATQSDKRLGFVAYLRQHFAATHWPAAFGICLGLLVIPVVSLLKPILEFRGLCIVLAGAFVLSIVSGIIYTVQRSAAFFFCGKRAVPDQTRSWMARLTYGSLMSLIPLAPWVVAEYFGPPYGLLAAIAPDLRKEQARWFGLPNPEADQKESGIAVSGMKKDSVTQDVPSPEIPKQSPTAAYDKKEVQQNLDATSSEISAQAKSFDSDNNKLQVTHDVATRETSTPPQTESANPFVVVEESPPSTEQPKNKTPPTSNKTEDEDPFKVIAD